MIPEGTGSTPSSSPSPEDSGAGSNDPNESPFGTDIAQDCIGKGTVDESHVAFNTNGRGNSDTGYGPTSLITGAGRGSGGFSGISRGHIVNRCPFNTRLYTNTGVDDDVRFKFNFLYNPSALNMSINVDTSLQPIENLDEFQATNYFGSSQSNRSFSFDLFLDRTFELMGGDHVVSSANLDTSITELLEMGPTRLGVYYDILYLQRLVGIFERGQPAQFTLVDFYWSKLRNPIVWTGYITGIDIHYTHFNPRMIPMRAVVNLSFQERWTSNIMSNDPSVFTTPGLPGSAGGGSSGIDDATGLPSAVTNGPDQVTDNGSSDNQPNVPGI